MLSVRHLARICRLVAEECERIAAEEATERRDWTDQGESPLGARRHCRAVRARVKAGRGGAAIVGRRHLLSPEALREVLEVKSENKPADSTAADQLKQKLRIVGGKL